MHRQTGELDEPTWRFLIEFAPDAIIVVDAAGRIVLANAQAQKLFGYERGDLDGQSVEVLVPLPFQSHHRRERAGYALAPGTRRMETRPELRGMRKDGTEFPAEIGLGPVETPDGPMVVCIVRNSQRVQRALQESELRYRRLFEAAKDGILILEGATGEVSDANPSLAKMLGQSCEQIIGKRLWEIAALPLEERSRALFEELQQNDHVRYADLALRTKGGNQISVEFAGSAYEVDGKRLIQCNLRDISERKRAEETLRQREEWYRELFEEDPAGNYVGTADGKLLACNPAFLRMFGFASLEEAKQIGLLPLQVSADSWKRFIQQLQTQRILRHYEEELQRMDGTRIQVLKRGIGTFGEHGELTTIHVQLIDESERLRKDTQIRQAQKMEALGRLAGGVAHDFNNLLGVIIGQSELMASQMDPGTRTGRQLREITKAAQSAASLTQQLLAYTRQQVLEPRVLDLNDVVNDAGKMLRRMLGEDVELVLKTPARMGKVKADPNQILQVILNLATNARDAMPAGGRLSIETANVDGEGGAGMNPNAGSATSFVKLEVRDTGTGMSQETMAQIFEPFFTTKGPGKGTGLGLSTVYGIVQQSGGRIDVQSEPGHGAAFQIFLPQAPETPAAEVTSRPSIPRGTETILVVEDSPDLRAIVRQFLEMSGYRVLLAGNGAEGKNVAAAHSGPIQLLLTDVVLPGGANGRMLAEQLHQSRPEMAVLFMSGYADDAVLYLAGEKQELHFLAKPFTRAELLEKISDVLQRRVGGVAEPSVN